MTIQITNRQKLAPIDRKTLRAICKKLLHDHEAEANLSLCYVDNATIRDLNARYRQQDEATDVLAFPLADGPEEDHLLGEVVVSVEKAVAEAVKRGVSLDAEIALYTVHGVLHLLGYDHQTLSLGRRMRRRERQALADAGLA